MEICISAISSGVQLAIVGGEKSKNELRRAFFCATVVFCTLAFVLMIFDISSYFHICKTDTLFFMIGAGASFLNIISWEYLVKLILGLKAGNRAIYVNAILLKSVLLIILITLLLSFKGREAAFAFLGFFLVFFSGMGLFGVKGCIK